MPVVAPAAGSHPHATAEEGKVEGREVERPSFSNSLIPDPLLLQTTSMSLLKEDFIDGRTPIKSVCKTVFQYTLPSLEMMHVYCKNFVT